MRSDVPILKRCCFCFPLRYGLLAWGYIKLVLDLLGLLYIAFMVLLMICFGGTPRAKNIIMITLLVSSIVADIVSSLVFICGAHRKNIKCLRISYYYGITILVLSIIMCVTMISFASGWVHIYNVAYNRWYIDITSLLNMFLFIIFQGYMLILLRSEIVKLNNAGSFRFTNNAAEAECTLQIECPVEEQKLTNVIDETDIEEDKTNDIVT